MLRRRVIITFATLSLISVGGFGIYLAQGRLSLTIVIATLIVAAITCLAGWLTSNTIIKPIRRLTSMAHHLTQGELNRRVLITCKDEFAELGQSLNQMAAEFENTLNLVSEQRNQLAAILSSMTDGIIISDGQDMVTLLNPSAETILELPQEKAVGHSFIEVVRDYELAQIFKQCLKEQKQQIKLLQMLPHKRTLRVIATPLKGEGDGMLLVLQDLTELKQLEITRREFITNVSHELRTPLASLKAIIETLEGGVTDDPIAAKAFVEKADTEVNRLTQLVDELAELFRIESGQAPMKKLTLDINELLTRVAERFQNAAYRSGLKLQVEASPNLPQVAADGERIEQVMANLVHNAIKFTPAGGEISLWAKSTDDYVFVYIRDTGIGIDADELPHIFKRFYKADKARGRRGSGLGLAIVKHIIDAHGGKIWVESTVGGGSTVIFNLPIAPKT